MNGTPELICAFSLAPRGYCALPDRHEGDHDPSPAPEDPR